MNDRTGSCRLNRAPAISQRRPQTFVIDHVELSPDLSDATSRVTQGVSIETAKVDQLLKCMRNTSEDEESMQDSARGPVSVAPWRMKQGLLAYKNLTCLKRREVIMHCFMNDTLGEPQVADGSWRRDRDEHDARPCGVAVADIETTFVAANGHDALHPPVDDHPKPGYSGDDRTGPP